METTRSSTDSKSWQSDSISWGDCEITPEYVREMNKPTDRMLCFLKDNNVLRFGQYRIKDYESGMTLMQISEE